MSYNDLISADATVIANEFLDVYMPRANGDYVKVYLYLARNRVSGIDVETIAEHLSLTEGDVRRAIRYWEKEGVVSVGEPSAAGKGARKAKAGKGNAVDAVDGAAAESAFSGDSDGAAYAGAEADSALTGTGREKSSTGAGAAAGNGADTSDAADAVVNSGTDYGEIRNRYRRTEGKEALNRLASDDEFGELLIIVQKYCSKILTEREEQVLAYLYDGLGLPADVLDYLVAYAVDHNHNTINYIEKTGLDWASHGIRTVAEAKKRTEQFESSGSRRTSRAAKSAAKNGITRGTDLDRMLLNRVVQRNML